MPVGYLADTPAGTVSAAFGSLAVRQKRSSRGNEALTKPRFQKQIRASLPRVLRFNRRPQHQRHPRGYVQFAMQALPARVHRAQGDAQPGGPRDISAG